jgi:hypothetical protein
MSAHDTWSPQIRLTFLDVIASQLTIASEQRRVVVGRVQVLIGLNVAAWGDGGLSSFAELPVRLEIFGSVRGNGRTDANGLWRAVAIAETLRSSHGQGSQCRQRESFEEGKHGRRGVLEQTM